MEDDRLNTAERQFAALLQRRRTRPVGDGELLAAARELELARQNAGIVAQLFGDFPANEIEQATWTAKHFNVNVTKLPESEVPRYKTCDAIAGNEYAEFKELRTKSHATIEDQLDHVVRKNAAIAVICIKDHRVSNSLLQRLARDYIGPRRLRVVAYLRNGMPTVYLRDGAVT